MHAELLSFLATVEPSQAFNLAALIPALISVLGMIKGNGSSGSGSGSGTSGVTTETTDPDMTALLSMMRQRTEMQNPLYEAVTRLALGLMPTAYQTGNNYPWKQQPYRIPAPGPGSTEYGTNNPGGPYGETTPPTSSNTNGTDPHEPFGGYPWSPLVAAPETPITPVRPWSPEGLRRPIVRPLGRE